MRQLFKTSFLQHFTTHFSFSLPPNFQKSSMIMVIINLLLKFVALLLVGASSVYGFIYSWRSWKPTKLANSQKKVVCVIGGGFGGLYSALYIAAKSDNSTEVLLVEPFIL